MWLRFHAGKLNSLLKPLETDHDASYKSATKHFCIMQGPNNISRLVACLLHKIPTGLILMTYAPKLVGRKLISTGTNWQII